MKDGYNTYLRYKKIIELLDKKECSISEIAKKTKIPSASVYKMIQTLLKNNVIIISETTIKNKTGRPGQVFKLKRRYLTKQTKNSHLD